MQEMLKPGFLESVKKKGAHLKSLLVKLKAEFPEKIAEVRGQGLMLGLELVPKFSVKQLQAKLLDEGFIVATAGGNTMRLVPPLVISKEEMEALYEKVYEILKGWEIE